jgi:integrase
VWRLQEREVMSMPVYKDEKRNTWFCKCNYKDWLGESKSKMKRGFATKKDAQQWERDFLQKQSASLDMKFASFVEVYFEDKAPRLKERSIMTKRTLFETKIIPYFGEKQMNEITAVDIIKWQNALLNQDYKPTYLRMIQNQMTALFNHAEKFYDLKDNPCKKVDKMGRPNAKELNFWTKDEYEQFIQGFSSDEEMYRIIFQMLFWLGCRVGDDDDKIRLNQRKPSKYKGLRRFGPEKNLQRINKFMKERPIFYKNLIQMKENIRFYLRCFYCITKVMILQFNSENRTELARNG